jgi:hypothetical protein
MPAPKITLGDSAVVTLERAGPTEAITRVIVERGRVALLNVRAVGQPDRFVSGPQTVKDTPLALAAVDGAQKVPVLAPSVVLARTKEAFKFGVEGVPVELKPGVQIAATVVSKTFAPAAFNPAHVKLIARSAKAKPMAVNMYSAWWSFVVCISVTVLVSLFTRPKPEAELKNLVMGLTEIPDEGPCPWYDSPKLWTAVVALALVAVNIMFW